MGRWGNLFGVVVRVLEVTWETFSKGLVLRERI